MDAATPPVGRLTIPHDAPPAPPTAPVHPRRRRAGGPVFGVVSGVRYVTVQQWSCGSANTEWQERYRERRKAGESLKRSTPRHAACSGVGGRRRWGLERAARPRPLEMATERGPPWPREGTTQVSVNIRFWVLLSERSRLSGRIAWDRARSRRQGPSAPRSGGGAKRRALTAASTRSC